jgi:hypothetical protein
VPDEIGRVVQPSSIQVVDEWCETVHGQWSDRQTKLWQDSPQKLRKARHRGRRERCVVDLATKSKPEDFSFHLT